MCLKMNNIRAFVEPVRGKMKKFVIVGDTSVFHMERFI